MASPNRCRPGPHGEGPRSLLMYWVSCWCTVRVVSPFENIVEDLKSLPPDRLEVAANFIRRLKPVGQVEREAALARTFGCLSPEEADEMERVIEEGCGQINEHGW